MSRTGVSADSLTLPVDRVLRRPYHSPRYCHSVQGRRRVRADGGRDISGVAARRFTGIRTAASGLHLALPLSFGAIIAAVVRLTHALCLRS